MLQLLLNRFGTSHPIPRQPSTRSVPKYVVTFKLEISNAIGTVFYFSEKWELIMLAFRRRKGICFSGWIWTIVESVQATGGQP